MNDTYISDLANDMFGIETELWFYSSSNIVTEDFKSEWINQLNRLGYHIKSINRDYYNHMDQSMKITFHELFTLKEFIDSLRKPRSINGNIQKKDYKQSRVTDNIEYCILEKYSIGNGINHELEWGPINKKLEKIESPFLLLDNNLFYTYPYPIITTGAITVTLGTNTNKIINKYKNTKIPQGRFNSIPQKSNTSKIRTRIKNK